MDTPNPDPRRTPGQPQTETGSLGRLNHEQLRLFFDTMVQGVAYCKMVYEGDIPSDFVYVDVNPAFATLTGLENVTGRAVSEVIPGIRERDPGLFSIYDRVARGGAPERFEYYLESLESWFSLAVFCPQPGYFVAVFDIITERKRTEQALRESEGRYRLLIESAGDAIYVSDRGGRLVDVNACALEQTGYTREELLGLHIGDVDPEYQRQPEIPSLEDMSHAGGGIFQTTHRRKDGTVYPVEVRVAVLDLDKEPHFMGIARDISERREMQEALIQSEKMMSVGGLAAGMAHEINNPLGGILQNVQVIRRRLTEDSAQNHLAAREAGCPWESIGRFMQARDIFRFLESIHEAGTRAARIVNSMLEFSRKSDAVYDWADINDLLDSSVALCSTDYSLKKKYDFRKLAIERDYAPGLPKVLCSKSKIQQVFMNILGNSAHALAGAPSPRITLRTRGAGDWVRIELEDNGPGMDETTRRKAFEPFYTTKPVGEGTGLGLSVSYFIITSNHRGTIEVDSEPGKGARFLIRLPVSSEPREPASR
ncbi:PAS domain S-box protein [Fundidesulfovibrio agrisoli]|uniref:PAS domain S-box protein n=1 Tax=Fundidesulfovibrio agrisoli TaxID=2922717 RepID=UPI001FAB9B0C|nr:PAS domain S-box protein [Fundidesulfovibrio agrisoli]